MLGNIFTSKKIEELVRSVDGNNGTNKNASFQLAPHFLSGNFTKCPNFWTKNFENKNFVKNKGQNNFDTLPNHQAVLYTAKNTYGKQKIKKQFQE